MTEKHTEHEMTEGFEQFLTLENVKFFLRFEKECDQLASQRELFRGKSIENDDMVITVLDMDGSVEEDSEAIPIEVYYFKVELKKENKVFFVKTLYGYKILGEKILAAEEFRSLQEAEKRLKGMKNVEVINYQFGYARKTDQGNRTYFVSEWVRGRQLGIVLEELRNDIQEATKNEDMEKVKELRRKQGQLNLRFRRMKAKLGRDFGDVEPRNVIYDKDEDIFYLIDVHLME